MSANVEVTVHDVLYFYTFESAKTEHFIPPQKYTFAGKNE